MMSIRRTLAVFLSVLMLLSAFPAVAGEPEPEIQIEIGDIVETPPPADEPPLAEEPPPVENPPPVLPEVEPEAEEAYVVTALSGTVVTRNDSTTLREEPDTASAAVATVPQGTTLTVIGETVVDGTRWLQVQYEGDKAFVKASVTEVLQEEPAPDEPEDTLLEDEPDAELPDTLETLNAVARAFVIERWNGSGWEPVTPNMPIYLNDGDANKTLTIGPSGANAATFKSSHPAIVTITKTDENFYVVKAVKTGVATITMVSASKEIATCTVEVFDSYAAVNEPVVQPRAFSINKYSDDLSHTLQVNPKKGILQSVSITGGFTATLNGNSIVVDLTNTALKNVQKPTLTVKTDLATYTYLLSITIAETKPTVKITTGKVNSFYAGEGYPYAFTATSTGATVEITKITGASNFVFDKDDEGNIISFYLKSGTPPASTKATATCKVNGFTVDVPFVITAVKTMPTLKPSEAITHSQAWLTGNAFTVQLVDSKAGTPIDLTGATVTPDKATGAKITATVQGDRLEIRYLAGTKPATLAAKLTLSGVKGWNKNSSLAVSFSIRVVNANPVLSFSPTSVTLNENLPQDQIKITPLISIADYEINWDKTEGILYTGKGTDPKLLRIDPASKKLVAAFPNGSYVEPGNYTYSVAFFAREVGTSTVGSAMAAKTLTVSVKGTTPTIKLDKTTVTLSGAPSVRGKEKLYILATPSAGAIKSITFDQPPALRILSDAGGGVIQAMLPEGSNTLAASYTITAHFTLEGYVGAAITKDITVRVNSPEKSKVIYKMTGKLDPIDPFSVLVFTLSLSNVTGTIKSAEFYGAAGYFAKSEFVAPNTLYVWPKSTAPFVKGQSLGGNIIVTLQDGALVDTGTFAIKPVQSIPKFTLSPATGTVYSGLKTSSTTMKLGITPAGAKVQTIKSITAPTLPTGFKGSLTLTFNAVTQTFTASLLDEYKLLKPGTYTFSVEVLMQGQAKESSTVAAKPFTIKVPIKVAH